MSLVIDLHGWHGFCYRRGIFLTFGFLTFIWLPEGYERKLFDCLETGCEIGEGLAQIGDASK